MCALKLFSTFFLIFLLCKSWATASDSLLSLVPQRHTQGVYVITAEDNYFVRIILPSLADRSETVREIAPGNLNVKGYSRVPFFDRPNTQPLVLEVHYEAGANGYTAKYSLMRMQYGVNLAGAPLLKSLAG